MIDTDILLANGAAYKKVAKGDFIFHEGSKALFYFQLVSGKIKWANMGDDGSECIHEIVEAGECFGELPLFDDEPYAATAVAEEDCLLLRLSAPHFKHLLHSFPDIHDSFLRLLSQRLRFKFMLMKELSGTAPDHRIISLIEYLKKNNKNVCLKCNKILLTRQQIANMTGLRVETVIRTIKNLQKSHILSIDKGKVYYRGETSNEHGTVPVC